MHLWLALLHLLLACILTLSGWLAPLFVLFALLLPLVLLLTHIEDGMPAGLLASERSLGRLWAVAPGVLVLTTVLFLTIPRLDAGGIGAGAGSLQAGFSGEMSLEMRSLEMSLGRVLGENKVSGDVSGGPR